MSKKQADILAVSYTLDTQSFRMDKGHSKVRYAHVFFDEVPAGMVVVDDKNAKRQAETVLRFAHELRDLLDDVCVDEWRAILKMSKVGFGSKRHNANRSRVKKIKAKLGQRAFTHLEKNDFFFIAGRHIHPGHNATTAMRLATSPHGDYTPSSESELRLVGSIETHFCAKVNEAMKNNSSSNHKKGHRQ